MSSCCFLDFFPSVQNMCVKRFLEQMFVLWHAPANLGGVCAIKARFQLRCANGLLMGPRAMSFGTSLLHRAPRRTLRLTVQVYREQADCNVVDPSCKYVRQKSTIILTASCINFGGGYKIRRISMSLNTRYLQQLLQSTDNDGQSSLPDRECDAISVPLVYPSANYAVSLLPIQSKDWQQLTSTLGAYTPACRIRKNKRFHNSAPGSLGEVIQFKSRASFGLQHPSKGDSTEAKQSPYRRVYHQRTLERRNLLEQATMRGEIDE